MISRGFFKVDEEIVKKVYKKLGYKKTSDFLFEMFTHGGRISYHEYEHWIKYLRDLAEKELKSLS